MASITKQRIGKYTYLYESTSYRDEKGRPRNKKVRIGKIDPDTEETIYLPEYLDRMSAAGTPIEVRKPDLQIPVQHITEALSCTKELGNYHLMHQLALKTQLLPILENAFPETGRKIFNLACYMLSTGDPLMYCDDWMERTKTLGSGSLSSQRISELFSQMTKTGRDDSYHAWSSYVCENDGIALDITSISSYSELMGSVEWGYNRDHEDLRQINLCMLLGEFTRLPIYYSIYSGSLRDVSTLRTTLAELAAICPDIERKVVMDKGFFSTANIKAMLDPSNRVSFLVSVPFTSRYAIHLVESEKKSIDHVENTVYTQDGVIRGVYRIRSWPGIDERLHTFVYFNPEKEVKERNELYGYVKDLEQHALKDPFNRKLQKEYNKYLIIRRSQTQSTGVTVRIRGDVVDKELKTAGWLVLIGNYVDDTQQAIDYYRMKDVVEKGFDRMKNTLDLRRLRVSNDERMENKIFVSFIALILTCAIDKIMKDKQLYSKYTISGLLRKMSHLHQTTVHGKVILQPITKEQREILRAFDLPEPVG